MTARQDTRRDGSRYYYVTGADGREYKLPSVTTILSVIGKPALLNWMAKQERTYVLAAAADLYDDIHATPRMTRAAYLTTLGARLSKQKAGDRAAKKAAEIGSNVHALCEWMLKRELYGTKHTEPEPVLQTEAAKSAFASWQDWRSSVHLKPIAIEQTVYSTHYGYAGTMDLYAEVDGHPAVIDWKTSKGIYPEYKLQIAAYAQALEAMKHAEKPNGYVVRLPKEPADGFEVLEVPYAEQPQLMTAFNAARELWTWLNGFDYFKDSPQPQTLTQLSTSIDGARTASRLRGLLKDNQVMLEQANEQEQSYLEAQIAAKLAEFAKNTRTT